MDYQVDAVVVGAGAVGLAVARALAIQGREVLILEAAETIGSGTSSRNSEVIHAGIYYPHDSLKARLCVRGKALLYEFCATHKIEHRRCGKLIVATDEDQRDRIESIAAQAAANGVDDLERLTAARIASIEPGLSAVGGLFSPSTGIIDSHAYMLALLGDAEAHGAMIAFLTPFLEARVEREFVLSTGGESPATLRTPILVNAAGLAASRVARRIAGLEPATVPETHYAKGSYFALTGARAPFRHLIYPIPERHGLGVHVTLDLAGQVRFGPDVEWVDSIDYAVDPMRARSFYAAIRRYWPALPDDVLVPAYSGIRPKLKPNDGSAADFLIQGEKVHGLPGLVNLFGIESPGLTASLAIAEAVVKEL